MSELVFASLVGFYVLVNPTSEGALAGKRSDVESSSPTSFSIKTARSTAKTWADIRVGIETEKSKPLWTTPIIVGISSDDSDTIWADRGSDAKNASLASLSIKPALEQASDLTLLKTRTDICVRIGTTNDRTFWTNPITVEPPSNDVLNSQSKTSKVPLTSPLAKEPSETGVLLVEWGNRR
jgi:hypothetical protein